MTITDRIGGLSAAVAIKAPCRVATTANITLAGLQSIDGIAVATSDRVLVKDQTDQTKNGIYDANSSTWTRTKDFNGVRDVVTGTLVFVLSGVASADTFWRVTSASPLAFGTSDITFAVSNSQLSGVSPFMQSVLDDEDGETARNTLGVIDTPGNNTVSTVKIIDSAVTMAKLNDGAITTAKVNDGAITATKQAADARPYDMPFIAGYDAEMTTEDLAARTYAKLTMVRPGTFLGEDASITTAPTGQAAIFDILKNGTTVYATKPQFNNGATSPTAGTLKSDGTEDWVTGDEITFSCTQVGSTEPGEGVSFTVKGVYT